MTLADQLLVEQAVLTSLKHSRAGVSGPYPDEGWMRVYIADLMILSQQARVNTLQALYKTAEQEARSLRSADRMM